MKTELEEMKEAYTRYKSLRKRERELELDLASTKYQIKEMLVRWADSWIACKATEEVKKAIEKLSDE